MSDSRKLKKHLISIKATEKLASAMKTVATAKFSKLSALNSAYAEYSAACGEQMHSFGSNAFNGYSRGKGTLYLLFTGNKGLCGGYNSELIAHFAATAEKDGAVIVCGKKGAELLAAKGIRADYFEVDDLPAYKSAEALLGKIESYLPEYGDVVLVYRRFVNALTYPISTEKLFADTADTKEDTTLYLPDKGTVAFPLASLCLSSRLYGVMLETATGAQAATLMTMRSAADNAKAEAAKTETALNRERQNSLTASVIESASGMINENF